MIQILLTLLVCTCVQSKFIIIAEGVIPEVTDGTQFGESIAFESTLMVGNLEGPVHMYDWDDVCELFNPLTSLDVGDFYYGDLDLDMSIGTAVVPQPLFGANGRISVFERDTGDNWVNLSDTIITKLYGEKIAYEFPHAIVTAYEENTVGNARVYRVPENVFVETLTPSFTTYFQYGRAIDIYNGVLAIGSQYYVYIYKLTGSTFSEFQVINGFSLTFGKSLAINEKYLAIGDNDLVKIYEPTGNDDKYVPTFIITPVSNGNNFGATLALYENVLVIGSDARIEIHYKAQEEWVLAYTKEEYGYDVGLWNGVAVASKSTTDDLFYINFCAPQCGECGDDGCGGICGTCDEFSSCESGLCTNIDECATCNLCRDGRVCQDLDLGYECTENCDNGFTESGDFECVDINECNNPVDNNCIDGFECINTIGSYVCVDLCVNADLNYDYCNFGACDTDLRGCSNTEDGLICYDCPDGYTNDGNECLDIDECSLGSHQCSGLRNCTNIDGGYQCGDCPAGYTNYKKYGCTDIDECLILGSCSPYQECINLPGSWACGRCLDGFIESNGTCVDIDECEFEYLNKCQRPRVCQNTAGSYTCSSCPSNVEALDDFICEGQSLGILGLYGVTGSTIILIILSLLTGIFTFVSVGLVFYRFALPGILEKKNAKIEKAREKKYEEKY